MKSLDIDKSRYEEIYRDFFNIESMISEFTLSNAIFFGGGYNQKLIEEEGFNYLEGTDENGYEYVIPLENPVNIGIDKLTKLLEKHEFLYPVDERWLHLFDEDTFNIESLEKDSDYVYLTERLATMAGRKLSKRRNLIKQFKQNYEHRVEVLNADNVKYAVDILNQWLEMERSFSEGSRAVGYDYEQCMKSLDYLGDDSIIKLEGRICFADDKPAGFTIGEGIKDDVFCFHFQKGIASFKGIYQFINQEFAQQIVDRYKYTNFAQDTGDLGLRQAKRAYYPDIILQKHSVSLKK